MKKSQVIVSNITEPSSTITKLARQKPAVIFMDINMPEINGYELCLMLQRSRKLKNVPVVMLTGQEGDGPRTKAKFVGAIDYLTKPFDPQKLVRIVIQDNKQYALLDPIAFFKALRPNVNFN